MKLTLSTRPGFFREILLGVLAIAVLGAAGFAGWWYWLRAKSPEVEAGSQTEVSAPDAIHIPVAKFKDITKDAKIDFRHVNGAVAKEGKLLKLLPETMGGGVAVFDFDKDGKQDILFVNSCYWPGLEDPRQPAPTLKLYRNKGN